MNRANLISLLLVSIHLPNVAGASPQTLWQEKHNYIAITPSSLNSDHPTQVKPQKLARMLSQLQVKDNKSDNLLSLIENSSDKSNHVFSNKEIDILAQGLSQAFAHSSASEAVTFTVSDFKSVYFGNKDLSVSGTAFIQNEKLNLIFGEIHVDLHKKYVRSGQGVSNSRFASNVELANFKLDTGSLTKAGNHNWTLQPFSGAELVNQRPDWIRMSLNQNYEYQQAISEKDQLEQKYLTEEQKKQKNVRQSKLEERIQKLEQASQTQANPSTPTASVEVRLRKLKALYDQGTIPESIYLNKMRSIVGEL